MAKIPGAHTLRSEKIQLVSGNGFGSTNTAIRRLSTVQVTTLANLMTYADSATLGASFTALKKVEVWASYSDVTTTGVSPSNLGTGWTINTTQPTTAIVNVTDGSIAAINCYRVEISNTSIQGTECVFVGIMNIGDVLRAQPDIAGNTFVNSDPRTLITVVVKEVPV